jgi:toxin ParE1/3/4
MSRYVINILASQDLNEIADYFAANSLEAGDRFFRSFNRKCQQLVNFPNSGKSYFLNNPVDNCPNFPIRTDIGDRNSFEACNKGFVIDLPIEGTKFVCTSFELADFGS